MSMRKHLPALSGVAVIVLGAALATLTSATAQNAPAEVLELEPRFPRLQAVFFRPIRQRARRPLRLANLPLFRSADYEDDLSQPWSTDWPETADSGLSQGSRPSVVPEEVEPLDAGAAGSDHACPHCGATNGAHAHEAGPPELAPVLGPDPGNWLFRPFSISWFSGVVWGDELVRSRVDQHQGFMGGIRFGWDLYDSWGVESRFGFSAIDLSGVPPDVGQNADWFLWDTSVLFYPWGDDRWRPYFMSGMGVADISFDNDLGQTVDETLFAVVIGVGLKYRWSSRAVSRVEFLDNIAFGTRRDMTTVNNLSLMFGMEYRFGGSPVRYWPWDPNPWLW